MDFWLIAKITILTIGLLSIMLTLIAKQRVEQKIETIRDKALPIVREIIQKSYHDALWSIAGELDPRFYRKIYNDLFHAIEKEGMNYFIIAGPRIVVEDEDYNKYFDPTENKVKGNYWEAHPLLKLAYFFHSAKNGSGVVKLHLRLYNEIPRQNHCFCSSNKTAPVIIEFPHSEYERPPVLIERNIEGGYVFLKKRFNEMSKSDDLIKWQPNSVEATKHLVFWKYSDMLAEGQKISAVTM